MNIITKEEARSMASAVGLPAGPISNSQITTYMMCARSYYLKYIQRVKIEGYADNLVIGNAVHSAFESLLKDRMAGRTPSLPNAYHASHTSILQGSTYNGYIPTPVQSAELASYEQMIKKICQQFLVDIMPELQPTASETRLWCEFAGIPCIMKIDLIDNNNCVSDFKVTRKMKSEAEAENSLQLAMYGAATQISKTSFISTKFPELKKANNFKPDFKEVTHKKSGADFMWAEEVVGSISEAIIKGVYPHCDPGHWKCRPAQCEYWPMCRGKERRKIEKPSWMGGILGGGW